ATGHERTDCEIGNWEIANWQELYAELAAERRATTVYRPGCAPMRAAAERLPAVLAALPESALDPRLEVPEGVRRAWTAAEERGASSKPCRCCKDSTCPQSCGSAMCSPSASINIAPRFWTNYV